MTAMELARRIDRGEQWVPSNFPVWTESYSDGLPDFPIEQRLEWFLWRLTDWLRF